MSPRTYNGVGFIPSAQAVPIRLDDPGVVADRAVGVLVAAEPLDLPGVDSVARRVVSCG